MIILECIFWAVLALYVGCWAADSLDLIRYEIERRWNR